MLAKHPRIRASIEPLIGILFFVAWVMANSASFDQNVPLRTETFVTNPYAIAIAVGFALCVALCRFSPVASFSILGGLLLLQVLFWPARFSQDSWDACLVLILLAVAAGAYSGRIFRRFALPLLIVYAVAVSALLTFPNLSLSGEFGTIDGTPWSARDLWEFIATWAVVATGVGVGGWFAGRRLRPRPVEQKDVARTNTVALESLSPRERQIFLLAAEGKSNREIAESASIEESTVKTHLNSISTKLGLKSRMELIAFAYREGVLLVAPAAA
jgi:DNA-binding CsgD family transcriptional regulator